MLKIENDEVRVHVIHGAVGSVSESDVMLAAASNAIIVAFNTGVDPVAKENADRDGVEIRSYNIIYDAIEEIEAAMRGMRAPKYRDVDTGTAEVREVYKISSAGTIAGSLVTSGNIRREGKVRLVRDGKQLADVPLKGLKRFKDDVKDVSSGYECGISLEGWDDIQPYKAGDHKNERIGAAAFCKIQSKKNNRQPSRKIPVFTTGHTTAAQTTPAYLCFLLSTRYTSQTMPRPKCP